MVFVDKDGFVCFVKLFSVINIMLLLVVLVNLFIFRFGNVMVLVILGCLRVILDICEMILLVLFNDVVLGS